MTSAPLTNTHIHTNFSFSVFDSPEQAVEQAVREGVAILGINDHYTVAGHDFFRLACAAHGICPLFSMEAVALDAAAQRDNQRLNDPANPGRCYLSAKSATRPLEAHSRGARALDQMRAALSARNAALVDNINRHLAAIGEPPLLSMADVEALTPAGNTTERHVIQVLADAVMARGDTQAADVFSRLCGVPPPALRPASGLQDWLRGKLIKAGCPDYAPEAPEAFLPIDDMIALFLDMGAIPTYPVLGNPVTEREQDIPALLRWCEQHGMYAIEVIPNRNTRERLLAIVEAAQAARIPVFTGTEHNTKTPGPLVDMFSREEPFRTVFFEGALVALGHAEEVRCGNIGYMDSSGALRFADRDKGMAHFREIGERVVRQLTPS